MHANYRRQNVSVMGVCVEVPEKLLRLSKELNLSFPLVSDRAATLSKKFGFYDGKAGRAARAAVAVSDGKVLYSTRVNTTRMPTKLLPWVETLKRSA